jgi:hypothetical protein
MGVVRARIPTVEDIYRLIWNAVARKRPIEARYHGHQWLFCPHRLGRNREGQFRVLCYQYGGQSESGLQPAGSPGNWRCLVLEELSQVKLREDAWRTAPTIPALLPAWLRLILTPRIIPKAIHKRGSEGVAGADTDQ